MSAPYFSRRDVLKASAAIALANTAVRAQPVSKPAPVVGIALGPAPLATGDLDKLFDDLRTRAGVNVLLPFIYTYVNTTASMPAANFRGGNFAMPHMEFYKNVPFKFEEMRAPEFGDIDVFARTIPAAKKHGIKTFAWILEDNRRTPLPAWEPLYEIDFHGRRGQGHPSGPCYNNPGYIAFVLALVEDYTRSYDIEGLMWSSERQGGLFNALGAWHHGATADPAAATCFCEFCTRRGKDAFIDVEQAKKGFAALEQFVREGRANRRPRDGYFVSFFRLLLNFPELLAWENLWLKSRQDLQARIYALVKSIKPIPVGWHIWHNVSFSPLHRAEMDFGQIAKFSDFIKPVLYNNCAGERIKSLADSVSQNVFGDLSRTQTLDVVYQMLGYNEAPYDKVLAAGLSADYVQRETRRILDDATAGLAAAGLSRKVDIWPGIDVDVPVPAGASQCTAQSVKESVICAFKGGATGIILSRNYTEMDPAHLAGAGAALTELGYR